MRDCPDCGVSLKGKSCPCGWHPAETIEAKPAIYHRCDYCREELRLYRRTEEPRGRNRIIGRSQIGGYVCLRCYQRQPEDERNGIEDRVRQICARDDRVRVMVSAAQGAQTREDRHDLIQWMKDCVRGVGALPYDKNRRVADERGAA